MLRSTTRSVLRLASIAETAQWFFILGFFRTRIQQRENNALPAFFFPFALEIKPRVKASTEETIAARGLCLHFKQNQHKPTVSIRIFPDMWYMVWEAFKRRRIM